MRNQIFTLLIILLTVGSATAQDIHFSQFYTSPLNLNPAMTGLHNCRNRAVVNYRNQWASAVGADAYNTFSASYDIRRPIGYDDFYGVGATLWGDEAGQSNYGSSQLKFSGSYSKKLFSDSKNKASYLVFGAEAGITQRRITSEALRWPSQYTNGLFNGALPSGEVNFNNTRTLYGDLSTGVIWYSLLGENKSWYAGVAAHHINSPKVSLLNTDNKLSRRYTIHGGMEYPISRGMSIVPYAVYLKQGVHWQTTAGSSVRFKMNNFRFNNESWQVGLWYRVGNKTNESIHSDAIILSSRIDLDKMAFGFSYDATLSSLQKTGTAVGSFEFSMVYKICGNFNRGVYCPQF